MPLFVLCGYIYCKDKIEKEPIGILLILFGFGAISYIPALMLEKFVLSGIDNIFVEAIPGCIEPAQEMEIVEFECEDIITDSTPFAPFQPPTD